MELDPTDIQNDKTLSTFPKRSEDIENEKLLLNLSDVNFLLSVLKKNFAKAFSKMHYLKYFRSSFRGCVK